MLYILIAKLNIDALPVSTINLVAMEQAWEKLSAINIQKAFLVFFPNEI